jgi:proteic killer suppression protein
MALVSGMIRSFADKDSRALFDGKRIRRWQAIEAAAMRKLAMLNRAARLEDLRIPPANRLEALRGDRAGQYSIRINDQFRICFVWKNGDACDVEIVDYH